MSQLRVLMSGKEPQRLHYVADMTAGGAIRQVGGDPGAAGMGLSVDGRRARADTPVRAGATIAQQPLAYNG